MHFREANTSTVPSAQIVKQLQQLLARAHPQPAHAQPHLWPLGGSHDAHAAGIAWLGLPGRTCGRRYSVQWRCTASYLCARTSRSRIVRCAARGEHHAHFRCSASPATHRTSLRQRSPHQIACWLCDTVLSLRRRVPGPTVSQGALPTTARRISVLAPVQLVCRASAQCAVSEDGGFCDVASAMSLLPSSLFCDLFCDHCGDARACL